jgi:pimeloyl-ACP methyl ester carboxylesterase
MFAPLPVPERFRNGFSHGMALRPWQIRAEAQDGAIMAFGVAAMRDRYPDLRMPVAIMVGSEDRVVDVGRHSIRLHEQIPHSELRVVPGVGHMVHHAVPDEVAQMIETIAGGSSGQGRLMTRSTAAAGPRVAAEIGAAA